MKTQQEIIDETIEYYRTHPRGMNIREGECMYLTPDGCMCAVGRCMSDPQDGQHKIGNRALGDVPIDKLDLLLKSDYRGHNLDFWGDLQNFHDTPQYWETEEGGELTEYGLKKAQDLHAEYA